MLSATNVFTTLLLKMHLTVFLLSIQKRNQAKTVFMFLFGCIQKYVLQKQSHDLTLSAAVICYMVRPNNKCSLDEIQ